MAQTNSGDAKLNSFDLTSGFAENNSGIENCICVNSGNEKQDFRKLKFNQTYTLGTTGNIAQVNVKLLDSNDYVGYEDGSIVDGSLTDRRVFIYGHPNKYVYDYRQEYNNCGVNSCLNVLSMAGVKDIVQLTQEYQEWLATPDIVKKKVLVWNEELGEYEEVIQEVEVYRKAPTATEDAFLLWAVQNSKNDATWLTDRYNKDYDSEEFKNTESSYTIHTKNHTEYQNIEDLKANPGEVGGSYYWQRENILDAWGVETTSYSLTFKRAMKDVEYNYDPNPTYTNLDGSELTMANGVPKTNEDGTPVESDGKQVYIFDVIRTTVNQVWDEYHKEFTKITTVEELQVEGVDLNNLTDVEKYVTTVTTQIESAPNTEYFEEIISTLCSAINEGKGIIIKGYANAFLGEKGGNHAISVVGYVAVEDHLKTYTTRQVTIHSENGDETFEPEVIQKVEVADITGFYVMDTGGFLAENESPQYIDVMTLYKFLTDTVYIDHQFNENNPGDYTTTVLNITDNNIREWSDALNLNGNNRKNILYGNNSKNTIHGKDSNDVIYGEGGNDMLYGDNHNDTLIGGNGNDTLIGGKGNDAYIFSSDDESQTDVIIANSGKDYIEFATERKKGGKSYGSQIDKNSFSYQNENGNLLITYNTTKIEDNSILGTHTIKVQDFFKKGLYSNLSTIKFTEYTYGDTIQDAEGNTIRLPEYTSQGNNNILSIFNSTYLKYSTKEEKINKITGTKFCDSIEGGNKNDSIVGGAGSDILYGKAGSDILKMGKGNDTIYGSLGDDKIYTESGRNYIRYTTNDGREYSGFDKIYGSSKGVDKIEMKEKSINDISYLRAKNDLVVVYNSTTGDSFTISNYFKKKGKTSVKSIELSDSTIDLVYGYSAIASQAQNGSKTTGTVAYDTIKGGAGNDSINGYQGHDVLYGGAGNDIIVGGAGNDKLYGQAGENTYKFSANDGNDTINFTKNTSSIIDISQTGLEVDKNGIDITSDPDYSYTKSKNNLVINYGASNNADKNIITIVNYFKQNGDFIIKGANGTEENLRESTVYFKGELETKNKITGSQYNDKIIGGNLNDTLNGAKGNDTIEAGLGNDVVTGGAGRNVINYVAGEGQDIINLTKGENLTINVSNLRFDNIYFEVVKKDLVISYVDLTKKQTLLTLKNFGYKDVTNNATKKTANTSSVHLILTDETDPSKKSVFDLRNDIYIPEYKLFSPKVYKYKGSWLSEKIDATVLNEYSINNDRGANINAGGGHDSIIGSMYNDTIKGGDGNDTITAYGGKNSIDGGNGSDTYHLFKDKKTIVLLENSIIKDTGKGATNEDTAFIYSTRDKIDIWFNVNRKGKTNYTLNITKYNDNKNAEIGYATITNVENIVIKDPAGTENTLVYNYNHEQLLTDIISFLNLYNYKDVNTVFNNGSIEDQENLIAIFNDNAYWQTV